MSCSIINAQTYNQGKIGAIVEIIIECDDYYLSNLKKSDLDAFINEILFQIASSSPQYLSITNIPINTIQSIETKISEDLRKRYFLNNNHTDKADLHIQKQIIKGVESQLNKFYQETCLLSQSFIKDKSKTVQSLIDDMSLCIGKAIRIKRFERYDIGKVFSKKEQYVFNITLENGIPLDILKEKCPKCGNRLVYVTYGASYEIICERHGCYTQTYKGL